MSDSLMEFLAEEFECEDKSDDYLVAIVRKRLYRATNCGVSFSVAGDGKGVRLQGYCEGSESDLPTYALTWPFNRARFWDAVKKADDSGVAEWNATHGCPECRAHWEDWEALTDEELVYALGIDLECQTPVWKECLGCGGKGIVI